MTLMEIFYPIILMLVGYLVEVAFSSKKYTWEGEGDLDKYLIDKGNFGLDYSIYPHLSAISQLPEEEPAAILNYISTHITPSYLSDKLIDLNIGKGTWNYIDPLEEVHNLENEKIDEKMKNYNKEKVKSQDKNSNVSIESVEIRQNGNNDAELIVQNSSVDSNNSSVFDDNPNEGNVDFQNEDLYRDRDKKNDVFMLRKVTKVYGDGKMACNNISFNLFRNEIFALLGRNGAGKTSLINGKYILLI